MYKNVMWIGWAQIQNNVIVMDSGKIGDTSLQLMHRWSQDVLTLGSIPPVRVCPISLGPEAMK